MKKQLRVMMIVCMCAALAACTSLRTVLDTQAGLTSPAQPPLAPNDRLTITTRDGTQTQVTLTKATAEFIEGSQAKDAQPRHFDLAEVVKIERREIDGVKTTLLVIAIAAGVYTIAKAAAEASLAGSL
jgi:hypothetical protein